MIRSILAVLGGAVVASITIWALEMLGTMIYPPPPGLDFSEPQAVRAAMEVIPFGALVSVLAAQIAGTFTGAWLAARLASRAPVAHAITVGILLTLASIGNMLMIPHPVWFWFASLLLLLPSAYVGGSLVRRTRASREPGLEAS